MDDIIILICVCWVNGYINIKMTTHTLFLTTHLQKAKTHPNYDILPVRYNKTGSYTDYARVHRKSNLFTRRTQI